ncbi:SusD/RagB family nutrient-binding outer membrane lipoprotein [Flavobacterium gilvum]|uniref:SusD/RagB family nutrient-binding outer membrane lipoprotein n=1 Tax=Flavobacterium gilvum TaxID=1492737 RepID=A0AAC9N7E2_9FLAO|nr:SusD/RagB family nutrient-binding outer membrane lipoprotein [Flavobacterium gilvum]AOW10288.1 hypothetical protein EM308_12660 [Flavobacterium gilvum]KFC58840.1 hypothetical protein FEM08_23840 [Flavobacterium gilvum]
MKFNNIKIKTVQLFLLGAITVATTSSCEQDFGDMNKAWENKVYAPTIPALFNSISASMTDISGNGRMKGSFIYQATQLAAPYASSGYRMDDLAIGHWTNYYTALANARKLESVIDADPNAAKMVNLKAMLKTMLAYKTIHATLMFGDMPYKNAGKAYDGADYYRPSYDSQSEIMTSALNDLKWAVDNLASNAGQNPVGASDVIFGGDIAKWQKLANSLRLRYALVIRGKNQTVADAIIADALTKPLLGTGDNYGLYPGTIASFTNKRITDFTGNSYIRMGSTMFNAMASNTNDDGSGIYDLRCKILFEPNRAGKWVAYPQVPTSSTPNEVDGNYCYQESRLTAWATPLPAQNYNYSPVNFYYADDETMPVLFITSAEVNFLKAEIYARGIGGVAVNPVAAKQFYEAGITESVNFWYKRANSAAIWVVNKPAAAPTPLEMTTMLSNPAIAYNASPAIALDQIYKQSWIALFHQPYEAWTLKRRTADGTPHVTILNVPVLNKFTYPNTEKATNFENWNAASNGNDNISNKPWFMM